VEGTEYDFRAGRPIGGLVLDTAFTDLGRDRAGRAEIELAAGPSGLSGGTARRRLWMDESFSHVMIFSGDTLGEGVRRRGLAVEPMTAPPDMLRRGDGLRVLEPGGRFEASWGIHP
jgi:aldose 1-epimerase